MALIISIGSADRIWPEVMEPLENVRVHSGEARVCSRGEETMKGSKLKGKLEVTRKGPMKRGSGPQTGTQEVA